MTGGPDQLPLLADEVVVAIEAAGISPMDSMQWDSGSAPGMSQPQLGLEIAGEIARTGDSAGNLHAGQRVVGFVETNGFHEYLVTEATNLVSIPDSVGYITAAAIPVAYGTALYALEDLANLKDTEAVVVLSAGVGMANAAIEVAKLLGGRVFAASALPEKLAAFGKHGADEIINFRSENLTHRLLELTSNDGIDVLYDLADGVHAKQALRAMATEGRCILLDWSLDDGPPIPRNTVRQNALSMIGMLWSIYFERHHEIYRTNLARCLKWCAEGHIRPYIQATYQMSEVGDALALLKAGKASGKLVLKR